MLEGYMLRVGRVGIGLDCRVILVGTVPSRQRSMMKPLALWLDKIVAEKVRVRNSECRTAAENYCIRTIG